MLAVGNDAWPLPIPIVRSGGRWRFDSAAGSQELINRRIGRNELLTIRTLLAAVDAQRDYFERIKAGTGTGAYAERILSHAWTYGWTVLACGCLQDGRLTGGFAFLAWPAVYGSSGIVTFQVNQDGVVFQKNLGPNTARVAAAWTRFDPDLTWARINISD